MGVAHPRLAPPSWLRLTPPASAHQLVQAQQELGQAYQELAQARPRLVLSFPAQLGPVQHQLAQAPRLLQPFQRLHGTRTNHASGNGLGLAIVDAIAAAHRATLVAQPCSDGGLTVEVTFPSTSLDTRQPDAIAQRPALQTSRGAQTRA
jgi:hypothetical protein